MKTLPSEPPGKLNKGIVIKNESVSDKNKISDSTTLKMKIS